MILTLIQFALAAVAVIFSLMAVYNLGKASVHHKYADEWGRIEREWADIAKQRKWLTRQFLDQMEARRGNDAS